MAARLEFVSNFSEELIPKKPTNAVVDTPINATDTSNKTSTIEVKPIVNKTEIIPPQTILPETNGTTITNGTETSTNIQPNQTHSQTTST